MTAVIDVVPVRVPERSWRSEWRAVQTVWRREMIRFRADKVGARTWLIQPLLFLFVLGSGLSALAAPTAGVDYKTLIFPGVICNAVLFTAMVSTASFVFDRELGFLREMTVAPIGRASILAGRVLAGTTIAAGQGTVVLMLAGFVDVPYDPALLLGLLGMMVLLAFAVSSFGMLVAVRIKQAQTFTAVMQMLVFPMFFLSGALFPVSGLPGWLEVLNRLNPLTYAVDPMRRLVFDHIDAPAPTGVTWFGWELPALLEVGIVLTVGVAMVAAAVQVFKRTE